MSAPEPVVLFRDAFEDPAFGARWTLHDLASRQGPAKWSVRSGVLRQTSNCYTPNSWRGTMLLARDTFTPPYLVRARLRSSDDDRMGLVVGAKSDDELHLFWLSNQLRSRTLSKVCGTSERFIARATPGYQVSRWTEVSVLVTQDRIAAGVDGEHVLDAPIDVDLSGRAGLYAHANEGLEVAWFEIMRAIGQSDAPARIPWQVHPESGRQTVVRLSNVSENEVWVKVDAWDQQGARVRFATQDGLVGGGAWKSLGGRHSASLVLGPPLSKAGFGFVELAWRCAEPVGSPPLMVSAFVCDEQGLGWSVPVSG